MQMTLTAMQFKKHFTQNSKGISTAVKHCTIITSIQGWRLFHKKLTGWWRKGEVQRMISCSKHHCQYLEFPSLLWHSWLGNGQGRLPVQSVLSITKVTQSNSGACRRRPVNKTRSGSSGSGSWALWQLFLARIASCTSSSARCGLLPQRSPPRALLKRLNRLRCR